MKLVRSSIGVVVLVLAFAATGCGGGGDGTSTEADTAAESTTATPSDTTASDTTASDTTASSAGFPDELADETKFAQCVLIDNGNDSKVTNIERPGKELLTLAQRYKAAYIVALRNDQGFFAVFAPSDPAQVPNLVDEFPATLEAQKLKDVGTASAEAVGPLAVGFLPYASAGDQVAEEELPEIEDCLVENG